MGFNGKTIYVDSHGGHVGILVDEIEKFVNKWSRAALSVSKEASYLTGLELKKMVADNFDTAHAMFINSTSGLTQGIQRVNPASYLWPRKPVVEGTSDYYNITWFNSEWLENDDQIYRPDYSVKVGRKVYNIRGRRVWKGNLASGQGNQPYYYWRILEYGTVSSGYIMAEIQSNGQSYYFMTSSPDLDNQNPQITYHAMPSSSPNRCVSRVAGTGLAKQLYDKYRAIGWSAMGGGNWDAIDKAKVATRFTGGGNDFALARQNIYVDLPGFDQGRAGSAADYDREV